MKHALGVLAALTLSIAGVAGAQPAPMRLALAYDGRLYIKVLDIQFDQTLGANRFDSNVKMKSYGVLALIKRFDIDASGQGRFENGEARPSTFTYINQDGKRLRRVTVDWTGGDVEMSSTPAFGNLGQPRPTRAQKLNAADPLTQMIRLVTSQTPAGACGATYHFFDGKQLYDLAFGPPEPASLSGEEQALGLVNPFRCTVRYEEIAGFKPKPAARRNQGLQKPITAVMGQIGGGGPWVIVSMSAETPIGPAWIVLRRAQLTAGRS